VVIPYMHTVLNKLNPSAIFPFTPLSFSLFQTVFGGFHSFAGRWIKLEIIMLSEKSQAQKPIRHVLVHLWNLDLKR
jgi:hypothetical protein